MTAPASPPNLEALERLLEEATQGPWSVEPFPRGEGTWYGRVRGVYNGHSCVVANVDDINDTHLIAAAINAAPALIAAARERDALEQVLAGERNMLAAAWLDRGEPLPGAEKQSTLQRVLIGIHELREALTAERQQREQAERREARLRTALEEVQEEVRAHIDQEAIRSSTGVVIPAIDRALYIIDAALAEGQDG